MNVVRTLTAPHRCSLFSFCFLFSPVGCCLFAVVFSVASLLFFSSRFSVFSRAHDMCACGASQGQREGGRGTAVDERRVGDRQWQAEKLTGIRA
jgi:hypothetical protein